jgi:tRNA threonylcarbamoyladenosine biosynthesis protein TsaB
VLILALDTSSPAGSAAIARDGVVAIERAGDGTRNHGERLPRELMDVLDAAGAALRDVDRFAIAIGPGSFTGLRVGIATMQGLALAQHKLVSPVSTFDALAAVVRSAAGGESAAAPLIGIWIDAHRGEVFATLYEADGRTVRQTATTRDPDATLDGWRSALAERPVSFGGDGAVKYADRIAARLGGRATLPGRVPPLAGAIATLAAASPDAGVSPHAVVPLYLRRPDVELARERRGR